jgi:hypothetical protein
MIRVDGANASHAAAGAAEPSSGAVEAAGRRFARCVANAASAQAGDSPPAADPSARGARAVPWDRSGIPAGTCGAGSARAERDGSPLETEADALAATTAPMGAGLPAQAGDRVSADPAGLGGDPDHRASGGRARAEEPEAPALDAARAQGAPNALAAAAAPRTADPHAAQLAQSMLAQLPLAGSTERSLTVSFPQGDGAVEQIVLTLSGGMVSLMVTARAPARDRVAAALPELARLLRSRGLRVGPIGLS